MVSGCRVVTHIWVEHTNTRRETNRNRHKLDSVIIFMLAVFDFGIGWCECESSLWETSDSYRAQHFECLWLRWGGRAGNDCEQRKRIIHRKMWDIGNWVTKHLRPIVLCSSSAIQYVKALLFLILARSSSKSRGHRVTLDIDFCFCFIAPYSRRSCGPQTLTPPRLPSVHSMLSLSRNKLSGIRIRSVIHFFLAYQRVLSRSSVFENRNMVRWLSSLESCPATARNLLFLTWLSLFAMWYDDVQLTVVRLLRRSDSWLRGYRLLSSRSRRSLCSNLISRWHREEGNTQAK